MITGINEFKASTKHTSYECKCNFDGRKCNSSQKMNVGLILKIKKTLHMWKDEIWNPATLSCENGKYVGSIIHYLLMGDEVIDATKTFSTKTVLTNVNENR